MSETINISEIAAKISKDIFKYFFWDVHQKKDDNFKCTNPKHASDNGKEKNTHPGDVVFSYEDPYLGHQIYLHTDLKSYKKDSITSTSLRGALRSLCMTVECANESDDWREKYSITNADSHEVRGLLFVHNYDHEYESSFDGAISKINLNALPLAPGFIVHFLGPADINRLYDIVNDLMRLQFQEEIPREYTYYYPDLVISRRQRDIWNQPATIEMITGPYIIIKYDKTENHDSGYLIYYNRPSKSPDEFVYFLDSLSRYQILESSQKIRIRVTDKSVPDDLKSIFQTAKKKYAKSWGFDQAREAILNQIEIERITSVTSTYNPGDMGWRE